jgi:hypothetical protein
MAFGADPAANLPGEPTLPSAGLAGKLGVRTAIFLLATVLDVILFTAYHLSDDIGYHRVARNLLHHRTFPRDNRGELRLLMNGRNTLAMAIIGENIQGVAASYIIFRQLLNMVALAIGCRCRSAPIGPIAACLVAAYASSSVLRRCPAFR